MRKNRSWILVILVAGLSYWIMWAMMTIERIKYFGSHADTALKQVTSDSKNWIGLNLTWIFVFKSEMAKMVITFIAHHLKTTPLGT